MDLQNFDLEKGLLEYHLLVKPFSGGVELSSARNRSEILLSKYDSGFEFDFDYGTFGDSGKCEFSLEDLHEHLGGQTPDEVKEVLKHDNVARLVFHKDDRVTVFWGYTEEEFDLHVENLIFGAITNNSSHLEIETIDDLLTAYEWAPVEVMDIAAGELSELLDRDIDKDEAEDILKELLGWS